MFDEDDSNDSVCQDEFGNVVDGVLVGNFAGTIGDTRGGSGGAGGGAVLLRSPGPIELSSSGRILARGGPGPR